MCIQTHQLGKSYGPVVALRGCSLSIPRGEILGILGPNGSGKTTLLRLLLGYLRPSQGWATVEGFDCYRQSVQVHGRMAYLPGEVRLFRRQRGHELLSLLSQLRPDCAERTARELAARLKLDVTRPVAAMSTGMRQKLALVATFAASAPWLLLDEPTSALDPNARHAVAQLMRGVKAAGRSVLLSSHVLSEVEEVCDRVVVMKDGAVVHVQEMTELRGGHRICAEHNGQLPEIPSHIQSRVSIQQRSERRLTIEIAGDLSAVLSWLADAQVADVRIEPLGLKSIYERFHPVSND